MISSSPRPLPRFFIGIYEPEERLIQDKLTSKALQILLRNFLSIFLKQAIDKEIGKESSNVSPVDT